MKATTIRIAIILLLSLGSSCSRRRGTTVSPPPPPPPAQDTTWTWTKLNWGGLEARSVIVDPSYGNIVYVASSMDSGGVWKSTDGGSSFVKLWNVGAWGGIALDPTNHNVLYASRSILGVWRSRDDGITWNRIAPFETEYVQPDRFDSSYIMAGHFRSTDYGATWTQVIQAHNGLDEARVAVQSWQNPNLWFAGVNNGAAKMTLKSLDRRATWSAVGEVEYGSYYTMAIDPWNDQRVYHIAYAFGSLDTLCRTTDGGATWERFSIGPDTIWSGMIPPVAVDSRQGMNQILYSGGLGVHRSVDYGQTWKLIGLDGINVRDIAVDPTAPTNTTVLYVAAPCVYLNCDRVYKGSPEK